MQSTAFNQNSLKNEKQLKVISKVLVQGIWITDMSAIKMVEGFQSLLLILYVIWKLDILVWYSDT